MEKHLSPEYRAYIESEEWQVKREAALRSAGGRCALCYNKGTLDVHHRTYARFGHEDPSDLTVLCRRCHDMFHEMRDQEKAKRDGGQQKVSSEQSRRNKRNERKRRRKAEKRRVAEQIEMKRANGKMTKIELAMLEENVKPSPRPIALSKEEREKRILQRAAKSRPRVIKRGGWTSAALGRVQASRPVEPLQRGDVKDEEHVVEPRSVPMTREEKRAAMERAAR